MKEENYAPVQRRVFSTGVGNDLDLPLRINMEKGLDKFSLDWLRAYGDVKAEVKFNFSQSDKKNYFFNSMDVTIEKDGEKISQKFYIDNTYDPKLRELYPDLNLNFTVKEAVNLLSSSFVMKLHVSRKIIDETQEFSMANSTKQVEPAWLEIDLTDKDKYGNYKVKAFKGESIDAFDRKLNEMPLKNLQNPIQRAALLKSLRRGDTRIPVTYLIEGQEYKRYIEYNARYKNFKVHESNLSIKEKEGQVKEMVPDKRELKQGNGVQKNKENQKATLPPHQAKSAKPKVKATGPKNAPVAKKNGKTTVPKRKTAKVGR